MGNYDYLNCVITYILDTLQMKARLLYKNGLVVVLGLIGLTLVSCKKNKDIPATGGDGNGTGTVPTTGTRAQLTLDSLFLYAKQIYYWNDALPTYSVFNPRQYSSKSLALDNYDDELYAITQLKTNPTTGKPYEYYGDGFPKYSYIQDLTLANPAATSNVNQANVDTDGNGNDIGIRPIYYLTTNSQAGAYLLFVTAVYRGSPAETAGVKRGWVITKVNGTTIGNSYTSERATVNAALAASSVKLEGVNYIDKVPFTITLNKASYKSSPVYASKVITRSGKKIGYLSFARFSSLTSPDAPSDTNLDPVFSDFSTQGITDLVVDLRYNGGGYINTAEYLANLIAPSGVSGKKMYTEIYNTTMQTKAATILSNQPLLTSAGKVQYKNGNSGAIYTYADLDYSATAAVNNPVFAKKGSLNTVANVVFIVSRNTASASELLINSLKPYMNVKLVGDTTYGKPVGFFPITLENRYEVFMSLFETKNSNNEGGYYTGMVPTVRDDFDDPRYVFGDERENYLSLALNQLAPTTTTTSQGAVMSVGDRSVRIATFSSTQMKAANPKSEFMGMIEKRRKINK